MQQQNYKIASWNKTLSALLALCKENVYSSKMMAYSATNDEKVVTLTHWGRVTHINASVD